MKSLFSAIGISTALLAVAVFSFLLGIEFDSEPVFVRSIPEELFLFTNTARGEEKLEWNECLASKAEERASKMTRGEDPFGHSDGRGNTPYEKLIEECFSYRHAGENLSNGQSTAKDVHFDLMQSPTHRKNILKNEYKKIGIGCSGNICVEFFAD